MWFDLTELEAAEVFDDGLTMNEGSGRSRQLARNRQPDNDYAAMLSKWESEAQQPGEPPTIQTEARVNAAGISPFSRSTAANKLMDHYEYLTFKVARDFAERFGLSGLEHFRLWGIARKQLHKLLIKSPATPPDYLEIDLICRVFWKWRTVRMDTPKTLARRMSDDETERQIIQLHGEGMKSRQIAERVGCSKSYVNNVLRRVADRYRDN